MKKSILILSLSLAALPLKAYDFKDTNEDGVVIYYNIIDIEAGTCEVAENPNGCYSDEIIKIPTEACSYGSPAKYYNSYVTGIGENAFFAFKGKRVYLPDNLEYIGDNAFRDSKCEIIVLPYTLKRIGELAFGNMRDLSEIRVEFDDPSDIELGYDPFKDIDKESCKLWVPKGSRSKFQNDPTWGDFNNINQLPFSFIEDGIAYSVLDEAAGTCEITSRLIGGLSVDHVNVIVPPTILHRGTSYTPIGVGDTAFEDKEIFRLDLPNTIEYIGERAFSSAYFDYKGITLPTSVNKIADYAFYCCKIDHMRCRNHDPYEIDLGDGVFDGIGEKSYLYVPIGCVDAYKAAPQWNNFPRILEDHYDFIYEDIEYKIQESDPSTCYVVEDTRWYPIEEVVIPETVFFGRHSYIVNEIGSYPFSTRNIKHIILPETIEIIGYKAFVNNYYLETINIPAAVKEIYEGAFAWCSGLKSLKCDVPDPADIALEIDVFKDVNYEECELVVPKGSAELYRAADQWKEFFNIREAESGIDNVAIDAAEAASPAVYYNLNGAAVPAADLAPGLYIRRQGTTATKVVIR